MFNVIRLSTSEPLRGEDLAVLTFETGEIAAQVAKRYTETTGEKHQPRRAAVADPDAWMAREQARFDSATYTFLPWQFLSWHCAESRCDGFLTPKFPHHFAHTSTDKPGMIAYTENAEKGRADIQTRVKPGVYLAKYFGDVLSQSEITDLARAFSAQYAVGELQFATTGEEMVAIYIDGPSSCMSHQAGHYDSNPVHPVSVYAAGDITLAYMTNDRGHCVARTLVWAEKKIYVRIYSDGSAHDCALHAALTALGYTQDSFYGARLLRVETNDGDIIVPYVDGSDCAEDCGKFLIIGRGNIPLDNQTGIGVDRRRTCDRCGDRMDDNDSCYIESCDETWCDHCAGGHSFYCEVTGTTIADTDGVELHNGERMSPRAFERNGFRCDATDENYPSFDYAVYMHDGETWCVPHFQRHGFRCEVCNENFANEDKHNLEHKDCGENTCQECAEDADDLEPDERPSPVAGRDESPDQLDLPIPATIPLSEAKEGDWATIAGHPQIGAGEYRIIACDFPDQNRPLRVAVGGLTLWVRRACIVSIRRAA